MQQFFVHKTLTEPHKEGNILPKENLIIVRKIIEKGHSMGITIEELKKLTGNDKPIQDYVMGFDAAHIFLDKIMDLFDFLLPEYVQEGKNSLVIAIGCTGGKHRSVTLANAIADRLKKTEYGCKVEHRDIDKDAKRKL